MTSALLTLAFQSGTSDDGEGSNGRSAESRTHSEPASGITSPADELLVSRIRLGDREAFDMLLDRYHLRLIGTAEAALGDLSEAEDLVQEILLQTWINRAQWQPKYGAAVYLFGAVTNRVRNIWRDRKRAENSLRLYRNEKLDIDSASSLAEEIADVWDEVALLPERWRTALILRYLHDSPFVEVGRAMRISENAAKKLVQRAVAALMSSFSEEAKKDI